MNGMAPALQQSTASDLRAAFDGAFAAPYAAQHQATTDYVAIRLGGHVHALALGEIAGLHTNIAFVPCPSPIPELMGLAGFRGALVPVYDLGALLGQPSVAGRWLALVADRSVAFAFDEFEAHFRVTSADIVITPANGRHHIHTIARNGEHAWPVIDLASLVSALRQRAARAIPKKE
jgi:purine-binding chemotaxis protein CheW